MTKYKGFFSLEVDAINEFEARRQLLLKRNLIQFDRITIIDGTPEGAMEIDAIDEKFLDITNDEEREIMLDLMKEKTRQKIKNAKDFLLVYTNKQNYNRIYQALDKTNPLYQYVLYMPEEFDDTQATRVYQTKQFGFVGTIIGNYISRDMMSNTYRNYGKSY